MQSAVDLKDVPQNAQIDEPIIQNYYLVNGEIKKWEGDMRDVYSPILTIDKDGTGPRFLGKYPMLSETAALETLDAALKAYANGTGYWPTLSVAERIEHMKNFVYRMKKEQESVVKLLMWEIGKSLADSTKEFVRSVEYIEETLKAYKNLDKASAEFISADDIMGQVRRAPLGVVLCMGPFNYPLNETFTTLIPALIMGNTVVFKPPKLGVLLYSHLLEAFRDSFPPGVLNTVYGDGSTIITPLIKSGQVDVLAFIGTSKVADIIRKEHPKPHRLRCVLGLDAKNPAIILPDADLESTVKECILGTLSFNGQRCTALKLLFVHESIADKFIELMSTAIANLGMGLPWQDNVMVTPLPEPEKTSYLTELIDDAVKSGAQVCNEQGGKFEGNLFYPALVYPVTREMRLYKEEQFGPIIPIVPFTDIAEPIQNLIESNYGQQVSVFGKDSDTIARLIDPLVNQVCRLNINSQCQRGPDIFPFTGRKDSAEGTLSISDALRVFSIRTMVAARENQPNQAIISDIIRENKSNFLTTV
ncbi:MAG TPA: NADP-dependent glyceraldehyde-3-phosphate dehydrogenase [Syntrophomonadaceae bacterium]|nr:NADP-dependent glyceraldehyde-3-phosphate dehydrogenase [Syntrophomonadaceae bacterium]